MFNAIDIPGLGLRRIHRNPPWQPTRGSCLTRRGLALEQDPAGWTEARRPCRCFGSRLRYRPCAQSITREIYTCQPVRCGGPMNIPIAAVHPRSPVRTAATWSRSRLALTKPTGRTSGSTELFHQHFCRSPHANGNPRSVARANGHGLGRGVRVDNGDSRPGG